MVKSREDFELETGSLFDDCDASIIDAYFAPAKGNYALNLANNPGATADVGLYLVLSNPDAEKPFEQFYTLGKGPWKSTDGKVAVNENKPESHSFNQSSNAGKVVARSTELIGGGDKSKGQEFWMNRDHYMTEAEFYVGLNFHWKREEFKFTIDGQERTTKTLLPNKWLGEAKTAGKAQAQSQSKPTAQTASAPSTSEVKGAPSGAVASNDELDDIVINLASGKTERDLKTAALKNDVLKNNRTYMKELVSGTVLKRLEDAGKLFKADDKYV